MKYASLYMHADPPASVRGEWVGAPYLLLRLLDQDLRGKTPSRFLGVPVRCVERSPDLLVPRGGLYARVGGWLWVTWLGWLVWLWLEALNHRVLGWLAELALKSGHLLVEQGQLITWFGLLKGLRWKKVR
jgi:hypothetical protein